MVEQWNNHDGRVDYFNNSKISDGWTVEHLMVEQWNSGTEMVEQLVVEKWNRNGETVELLMVEQETEMVKRKTSDGGTEIVEKWNI